MFEKELEYISNNTALSLRDFSRKIVNGNTFSIVEYNTESGDIKTSIFKNSTLEEIVESLNLRS